MTTERDAQIVKLATLMGPPYANYKGNGWFWRTEPDHEGEIFEWDPFRDAAHAELLAYALIRERWEITTKGHLSLSAGVTYACQLYREEKDRRAKLLFNTWASVQQPSTGEALCRAALQMLEANA